MRKILLITTMLWHFGAGASEKVGAWEVDIDESDAQVARTSNTDGAYSGVMCFRSSQSCLAYFMTPSNCEEKAKYPILVNSTVGAALSMATCLKSGNKKLMVLENFDDVIKAFEGGGEIGFALPLDGGKFSISRFNCSGATAAIRQVRALPPVKQPTKNPASQVL